MDAKRRILNHASVAVQDGRILEIGEAQEMARKYPDFTVRDCSGHLILPGLIDCHGHAGHSMLKGLATDSIGYWGRAVYRVYFHYSTDEFWYYDGLVSAADKIHNGVTTSINVMACEPRADSPVFGEMVAKGYREVGAGAVICSGPSAKSWPKKVSRYEDGERHDYECSWEDCMRTTETLLQEFNAKNDPLIRVFVTPFTVLPSLPTWGRTAPERCDRLDSFDIMQMREVKRLAERYHTGIHTDAFGNLIELMSRSDDALLGPNVVLQHCYDLSMEEVDILARTKTNVGHSPEASVRFCPYIEMLDRGVNAVVTSDGSAPRIGFDMLQNARRVQMLEHYRFDDLNYLPVGTLLEGITINAAKALGLESEIGSLEPGKRADIITVNMQKPHLVPWEDMPVHRLMLDANGHDVDNVFVCGVPSMLDGKLVNIDEAAVLERADQIARDAVRQAGLEAFWDKPLFGAPYRKFTEPLDFPE